MLINLVRLELLKTKRSLALLMMFLSPLMVVLVNVLILIKSNGKMIEENGWESFWLTNFGMWGYFMMPLYIALITALLNGIEHKNNGWRYLATLPIKITRLFFAKFILATIYLMGATLVLWTAISLVVFVFSNIGFEGGDLNSTSVMGKMIYGFIASLAILTIQHIVSWRWQNIVAPLGLGVLATFSILQFSGSKYWIYNPWAYTLTATNGSDISNQNLAIILSVSASVVLLFFGSRWLATREVTS